MSSQQPSMQDSFVRVPRPTLLRKVLIMNENMLDEFNLNLRWMIAKLEWIRTRKSVPGSLDKAKEKAESRSRTISKLEAEIEGQMEQIEEQEEKLRFLRQEQEI